MITEQTRILTEAQVRQIIRRIAFEIYENNFDEKSIVLAGVYDKGYFIAEMIVNVLAEIAPEIKVSLVKISIDKANPLASEVELDIPIAKLKGKTIVLVDDVLNTGKTLMHSCNALMEVDVKSLQTAALVNRSHKHFPLKANYKGYELATSFDEHVEVRLDDHFGVYLY